MKQGDAKENLKGVGADDFTRAKNAAHSASAAKSRYLLSVSHEIRSPLNSIYGYAQLLERGDDLDPVEAGRVIRRSAEHLIKLVEGLADIAQIENGILSLSKELVRFPAFLDQIADMVRNEAISKGLDFSYERQAAVPEFVRMDPNRLRQILINLLSNAIKFTVAGSVDFRVRYAGETATFEIADTGPGIAAEDHERVFSPFERGNDRNVRNQPGVGLGLAISDALVRILGGDMSMTSEVGVGTVFRVRMMLGRVAGSVGEAMPSRVTGYEGPQRAILVVDDDDAHLAMMRSLLEPMGFAVTTVTNGGDALAVSEKTAFALVLLDISMPGLSGWETASLLRARASTEMRILMVSAEVRESNGSTGAVQAHDRFVTKPVDLDALLHAIGAELDLCWTTGPTPSNQEEMPTNAVTLSALPSDAQGHVREIRNLARIGHARGLEAEVKQLAATAPEAVLLVQQLTDCLDRYDFAAMHAVLDGCA